MELINLVAHKASRTMMTLSTCHSPLASLRLPPFPTLLATSLSAPTHLSTDSLPRLSHATATSLQTPYQLRSAVRECIEDGALHLCPVLDLPHGEMGAAFCLELLEAASAFAREGLDQGALEA